MWLISDFRSKLANCDFQRQIECKHFAKIHNLAA